jgi:hypothetical protein
MHDAGLSDVEDFSAGFKETLPSETPIISDEVRGSPFG